MSALAQPLSAFFELRLDHLLKLLTFQSLLGIKGDEKRLGSELPDLAKKNIRHSIKFEFHRNNKYFSVSMYHLSHIFILKLIPCFSEIQIYLGILYFTELNEWQWLVLFWDGNILGVPQQGS